MSNLAYTEHYTRHDYYNWKGDWELIYGDAYAMAPSPLYIHQFVNGKIFRQLDEQLDNCSECTALIEMDVELSEDTVVRPDSMVICYPASQRLSKTPEIVFEVLSKSSSKRDELLKFNLYQDEGVAYYILVYPESNKAKVYQNSNLGFQKIGDFYDTSYTFQTQKCQIAFDFKRIWGK